jgi:GMC oxidoreductase
VKLHHKRHAVVAGERLQKSIYDAVYKPLEGAQTYYFLIVLSLLQPKSVGYLELRNKNPFASPRFYSNFYKDPEDVDTQLKGVRYVLDMIETEPFKKIGTRTRFQVALNTATIPTTIGDT